MLDLRNAVLVETKAPAHRLARGEVDELSCRHPAPRQLEELGGHGGDRVGLAQRTVSQPGPQLGRAGERGRPKSGVYKGSEQLDVGAHDDDVAWLERRVGL